MCHFIWNITNRFYSIRFVAKLSFCKSMWFAVVGYMFWSFLRNTIFFTKFCGGGNIHCSYISSSAAHLLVVYFFYFSRSSSACLPIYSSVRRVENGHGSFNMLTYSFTIDREPIKCTLEPHFSVTKTTKLVNSSYRRSTTEWQSRKLLHMYINVNNNRKLHSKDGFINVVIHFHRNNNKKNVFFIHVNERCKILNCLKSISFLSANFYDIFPTFYTAINLITLKREGKVMSKRKKEQHARQQLLIVCREKKESLAFWAKFCTKIHSTIYCQSKVKTKSFISL